MAVSSLAFVQQLSSFTPHLLHSIISKKAEKEETPTLSTEAHTFEGSLLIADVSGFTRLTGGYCARGKEGLDELSSVLGGYMGTLVDCIYAFNGDVINFAGDALICVFAPTDPSDGDDDDGSSGGNALLRASQRAVCCAWCLKEITAPQLSLHVGIGGGLLTFELLGGYEDNWTFIVSGRCLSELSQCLDDAPSKHVAITSSVLATLRSGGDRACSLHVDYVDGCMVSYPPVEGAAVVVARLPSGNCLVSEVHGRRERPPHPSPSLSNPRAVSPILPLFDPPTDPTSPEVSEALIKQWRLRERRLVALPEDPVFVNLLGQVRLAKALSRPLSRPTHLICLLGQVRLAKALSRPLSSHHLAHI